MIREWARVIVSVNSFRGMPGLKDLKWTWKKKQVNIFFNYFCFLAYLVVSSSLLSYTEVFINLQQEERP